MKYTVKIGVSQSITCVFDTLGDALDFAATLITNGYRATIIPTEGEEYDR